MFLSAITGSYGIFIAGVYGIIAAILVLALVFGRRARRNVKKEKITAMPDGFSPLDVQRIFIGKTYPRRLTKALIAHWAERGYIRVKYVSKYTVRIVKLNDMPVHDDEDAVFFDRGVYVRERDLFNILMRSTRSGKPVSLNKPLFDKSDVSAANAYAVREDEGVYTAKHYSLKILTIALSVVAALLAQISNGVNGGAFMGLIGVGTACIGLAVLMFAFDMPVIFKAVWCGFWLAASVLMMFTSFSWRADPYGLTIAAVVMLFLGPLFFVRFVDYREKTNLADYSDLINYRKFLLRAKPAELNSLDYYKVLPMLYAFKIKPFVKRKFGKVPPPDWYKDDTNGKGVLL